MKKSTSDPVKIVLIGPPGCGKGTQAKKLKEKFAVAHVSSGDVLRKEVAAGTDFGKKIKHFMDIGEIGPVELITEVIISHVNTECSAGFILDGFPRTLYQAEQLALHHAIKAAFFIDVSEKEIIARITGRRTCMDCGAIYHVVSRRPIEDNTCDSCQGELFQRTDDNEATVQNRIRVYNEETRPVVNYYETAGLLHNIDGSGDEDDIFNKIVSII